MFNIFKSKEEKAKAKELKRQDLQKIVDNLNEKWKNQLKSYCKIGDYIFILIDFVLDDKDEICVRKIDKHTLKDHVSLFKYENHLIFGEIDFQEARVNFLRFKEDLKRLNLRLVKISEENKKEM